VCEISTFVAKKKFYGWSDENCKYMHVVTTSAKLNFVWLDCQKVYKNEMDIGRKCQGNDYGMLLLGCRLASSFGNHLRWLEKIDMDESGSGSTVSSEQLHLALVATTT